MQVLTFLLQFLNLPRVTNSLLLAVTCRRALFCSAICWLITNLIKWLLIGLQWWPEEQKAQSRKECKTENDTHKCILFTQNNNSCWQDRNWLVHSSSLLIFCWNTIPIASSFFGWWFRYQCVWEGKTFIYRKGMHSTETCNKMERSDFAELKYPLLPLWNINFANTDNFPG